MANNTAWNAYCDKYNYEPKSSSQLQRFSQSENSLKDLSFKEARSMFNANKGTFKPKPSKKAEQEKTKPPSDDKKETAKIIEINPELTQGQTVNVDIEIFSNIFNLWFNTLNIQNATTITTKPIIECTFNYYTIFWLFTYERDHGEWNRNGAPIGDSSKIMIYSNGSIRFQEKEDDMDGYRQITTIKSNGCFKNKISNLQIQQLISYLTKLQINLKYKISDPDNDDVITFTHSYASIDNTFNRLETVNTLNQLFQFLKTLPLKETKCNLSGLELPQYITSATINAKDNVIQALLQHFGSEPFKFFDYLETNPNLFKK